MIDIFQLYQSFCSFVNTFQGGWYRPQSDFQNAVNNISNELWELFTRNSEKSQEARDNLIYLMKSVNIITAPQKGNFAIAKLPADYGRFASCRYILVDDKFVADSSLEGVKTDEEKTLDYYDNLNQVTIDPIDNQRWGSMLVHEKKGPTQEKPKCTQINGVLRVAPRNISTVVLDYYVKPTDAKFGYTITPGNIQTGAGDQIQYDKNTSVQLQWPTTLINEFLIRLGVRYGTFTRDQFMSQFNLQQKMSA